MAAANAAADHSAVKDVVNGTQALNKLKSTDPASYLFRSEELAQTARLASAYLFSSLKPYTPKCPLNELLVNGFDTEQIWQQIDLQARPLISSLRRKVKNFDNNPQKLRSLFNLGEINDDKARFSNDSEKVERESGYDSGDSDDEEIEDSEEGEEEEEDDEDDGGETEEDGTGVEDKFLKIKELEEYMEEDEAREYGLPRKEEKMANNGKKRKDEEVEEGEEEDDEDDDEEDEDGLGMDEGEDDGTADELGNARYDDFFRSEGKAGQKRKSKPHEGSDDLDMEGPSSYGNRNEKKQKLSTHEKELEKVRSTIEQMEKANLEPKTWTMQGEVTAAKRPKNSALEVDLDFEHNVRPAPVITDEVTASLEQVIQKRILEGHFDDVQKPPTLQSSAPKQLSELDDNKSKKGLAEIYEEEYVQKSGLVSTALSLSDQQKKEATKLFKELCLKLDALSHFHFTPKPVIEDMSIQANVPALAMEEIAPLAVSDAAMLAPEEVFAGKGDVKEEKELTQADRKRRRAKKKRKFKAIAAERMLKNAPRQESSSKIGADGNNEE